MLDQLEEALRALNLFSPPNSSSLRWRALTLMKLGRIEEARADIRALLALQPGARAGEVMQYFDHLPNHRRHIESLRQAGLPE